MTAKMQNGRGRLATAVLLALAALAVGKTMFVGLEIDEQYALSISWRLVQGDALFDTMWEPHQLSALPLVLPLWLFTVLTGSTTGVLLFVRALMAGIKAALAFWFYRTMTRARLPGAGAPALSPRTAFLAAVLLFAYTPKWFLAPDYISQQFHFTLAAFLCLYNYLARGGLWRAVLGGVALSFSVLAFPQSALSAPVLFVGLFLLGRRGGERRAAGIPAGTLAAFATCAVCAAAFLIYVLQRLTLPELIERALMILNDPQYDFSTAERLGLLAGQALSVARHLALPAAAALVLTVLVPFVRARRGKAAAGNSDFIGLFAVLFCLLATLQDLVWAVATGAPEQRTFLPVLALLGVYSFRRSRGTAARALFWLGYLPGLVAYAFILRSTLLGLSATFMYLTWPALCAVLALAAGREPEPPRRALGADGLLAAWVAFILACRLCQVLVTGWHANTVLDAKLVYLSDGPAACTWADETCADMYYALEQALEPHAGAQVLLTTGDVEGLAFLMDGGSLRVGQASVISSTDSDPRFEDYYRQYPGKVPDVIVYNDHCVRDLDEFHAWLESTFTITSRETVTYGSASLQVLTVAH